MEPHLCDRLHIRTVKVCRVSLVVVGATLGMSSWVRSTIKRVVQSVGGDEDASTGKRKGLTRPSGGVADKSQPGTPGPAIPPALWYGFFSSARVILIRVYHRVV